MRPSLFVMLALLAVPVAAQPSPLLAQPSPSPQTWVHTDNVERPRDLHQLSPVVPVEPQILQNVPWQAVAPGRRRKVLFCDRLTLVLAEFTSTPEELAKSRLTTHSHAHDQVTLILEGRALVQVGDQKMEVGAGGAFIAPSNVIHGARPLTERLVILDTFTPTREDFRPR